MATFLLSSGDVQNKSICVVLLLVATTGPAGATAVKNTGVMNRGVMNTGVMNTGVMNTGVMNTGVMNSGNFSTAYMQGGTLPSASTTQSGSLQGGAWDFIGAFPVSQGETFSAHMTGAGDADLYVRFGSSDFSSFDCRPYTGSANENCDLAVPAGATTAYVSVNGYSSSSTFSIDVTGYDSAGFLNTGYLNGGSTSQTKMVGSGSLAQQQWAQLGNFPVTAGNTLTVHMTGTGDADLYVKFGQQPDYGVFDCRPYGGTANEDCNLVVPSGATMAYVAVNGYSASSAFSIDLRGFDMGVSAMTNGSTYGIDSVALSGSALTGNSYHYGWTQECEDPYGCWSVQDWFYGAMVPSDFVGATMQMTITGEDQRAVGTAPARITSVTMGSGADSDVYLYTVEVQLGRKDAQGNVTNSWYPFCGTDGAGHAIQAIALQGSWNYGTGVLYGGAKISNSANQLTWGCLNGALGKAAAGHSVALPDGAGTGYGYKPWASQSVYHKDVNYVCDAYQVCHTETSWSIQTSTGSTSHQAATRMIRADYCGDGMPHTIAGRALDIWDMLPNPVNTINTSSGLPPGASWTYGGANDFGCNGRVEALWPQQCGPGGVYCEGSCPSHEYTANGQVYWSAPHQFDVSDDGGYRCESRTAYTTSNQVPGSTFNRNELVNNNDTWGSVADQPLPQSLLH